MEFQFLEIQLKYGNYIRQLKTAASGETEVFNATIKALEDQVLNNQKMEENLLRNMALFSEKISVQHFQLKKYLILLKLQQQKSLTKSHVQNEISHLQADMTPLGEQIQTYPTPTYLLGSRRKIEEISKVI